MKNKLRCFAAILALLMCFTGVCAAYGEAKEDPPAEKEEPTRGACIDSDAVTIMSPSAGRIKMSVTVFAKATMQQLGFKRLSLQHWNGSSWDNVWEVYDNFVYNDSFFTYTVNLTNCISGGTYRAKCLIYAKKSAFSFEYDLATTNSMICQ